MLSISLLATKVPKDINTLLPDQPKIITFINFYSITIAQKYPIKYSKFDYIASDGFLLTIIFNILIKKTTKRISFDMSSLAPIIFQFAIDHNKSIYFIGSKDKEIEQFVTTIQKNFPLLNIIGYRHGYFQDEEEKFIILQNIISIVPDIIIIGMGIPAQDIFAINLKEKGFTGTIYTCGGFIHQTQTKKNYYPKIINSTNTRFLYRIAKEKHVFQRIIKSIFPFILFVYRNKKKFAILRKSHIQHTPPL